ncbi:Aspartate carbamoyltransferase [Candidatus Xenohaliotis californiensis]|uniref:Aspartate carbamoyltransferase n=1 Tax=Candidatus Xenohaliotis californiensis TaxID=84677 RepID=A0ABP0EVG3_9RICK|nr:Aspartate carbamoyltransferase [Candidatus Xenohaliotis californiensis]
MLHFLSIKDLSKKDINNLVVKAIQYYHDNQFEPILTDKIIINLFLEPSTRTLTSFSIAAYKLGANVINFNPSTSSLQKDESIVDTIQSIAAMDPDMLIIRSSENDLSKITSKYCHNFSVINAGSGTTNHPTQALLDLATIMLYKKNIKNLNVAICGNTLLSRVANSNINLLSMFGANITIISPPALTTKNITENITVAHHLNPNLIAEQDVLMILRPQEERMMILEPQYNKERIKAHIYSSKKDLYKKLKINQITPTTLLNLKKDAIIMHPGPVNKNVEVMESVLSDDRVVINNQVKMGVCMRKAILKHILV